MPVRALIKYIALPPIVDLISVKCSNSHFKTQVKTASGVQRENPTDQSPSIKLEKKSAFPTAVWPFDIFQIGPIYMRAAFSSRAHSRLAPERG